jgi:hypothetical protein
MNWKRVEEIFSRALEYEGDERALSIREACGGDSELLCQVSSLLETHEVLEAADREGSPSRLSLDPGRAALLLDSDLTELTEGTQIGRYQVIRKVAQGGTGVVYLAFDPRLDRRVALKLLRWRTTDPSANRRLEEEARATSAPDHPHIATIYEIGESEGGHRFIAMAWYEGGTLRDRLNGSRFLRQRQSRSRARSRKVWRPPTPAESATATSSPRTSLSAPMGEQPSWTSASRAR